MSEASYFIAQSIAQLHRLVTVTKSDDRKRPWTVAVRLPDGWRFDTIMVGFERLHTWSCSSRATADRRAATVITAIAARMVDADYPTSQEVSFPRLINERAES